MPTYEDIVAARGRGDEAADALVQSLLATDRVNNVNQLFRTFGSVGHVDAAALGADVAAFLRETAAPPPGWSEADVRRAEGFFSRHQLTAAAVQATAGLIGTYLSPTGAYTLHSTHQLDRPHRRLAQSSRLFMGMGDKDALRNGSLAATCQKVRLVHASVRQLHENSGTWEREKWGAPVSQTYTAGAGLVFSAATLDGMKNIGVDVSGEDADGFCAAWHYCCWYLGVEQGLLVPKSAAQAHTAWDSGRDLEWKPSREGVLLTKGAIEFWQEYMPVGLKGAVPAFARQALGDRYADMVEIDKGIFDLAAGPLALAHGLLQKLTPKSVDTVVGKLGRAVEKAARHAVTHGQETEPQMHDSPDDITPGAGTPEAKPVPPYPEGR